MNLDKALEALKAACAASGITLSKALEIVQAEYSASDAKWRQENAQRSAQQSMQEFGNSYMAVAELLAPILRNNAAALGIVPPVNLLSLTEDPPFTFDRGAIFYNVRVDKLTTVESLQDNGSLLKYRINQQMAAYCRNYWGTIPQSYAYLLSNLRVVAVRDLGFQYVALVGRIDHAPTRRYIDSLSMRHRQPTDRHLI